MGLLSKGTPLSWEQSKRYHDYVKRHGIVQFLNIYRLMSSRENDIFLWGDEVEHQLVQVDPLSNTARLSLRAPDILQQLEQMEASSRHWNAHFVPEYGRHMIEATPARPYGGYTADLRLVEANMRLRRQIVQELLHPNEYIMTITAFPLLGVGQYALPPSPPHGPIAQSLYVSDSIIGPHPRFATLSRNIRIRRGSKVCIRVPLFQDRNTRQSMERQLRLRDAAVREIRQERKNKETAPAFFSSSSSASSSSSSAPSPSSPPAAFQPPMSPSTAHLPLSPVGSWPLVTSATNLSASGDELFPPIPDCNCLPPINELEEIHMDAMAFGMGSCCLSEDSRLLTSAGFLFLDEVLGREESLLFASYNPATAQLEYHPAVPRVHPVTGRKDYLTLRPHGPQRMVDFTQKAEQPAWAEGSDIYGRLGLEEEQEEEEQEDSRRNHLSLLVTEDHDMYVQRGKLGKKGVGSKLVWDFTCVGQERVTVPHAKVKASALVDSDYRSCIRMLSCATGGVRLPTATPSSAHCAAPLPFIAALGLETDAQVSAFLELYGFWLGDGSLEYRAHGSGYDAVAFAQVKKSDCRWLRLVLLAVGLQPHQLRHCVKAGGRQRFLITDRRWFDYFHAEYGRKYSRSSSYVPPAAEVRQSVVLHLVSHSSSSSSLIDLTTEETDLEVCPPRCVSDHVHESIDNSGVGGSRDAASRIIRGEEAKQQQSSSKKASSSKKKKTAAAGNSNKKQKTRAAARKSRKTRQRSKKQEAEAEEEQDGGEDDEQEDDDTEDEDDGDEEEEEEEEGEAAAGSGRHIASCKWFCPWVLTALSRDQVRLILEGYRRADGSWKTSTGKLFTSSVQFRDELCIAALHAGYAAHFELVAAAGSVRNYQRRHVAVAKKHKRRRHVTVVKKDRFISPAAYNALPAVQQAKYSALRCRADAWMVRYVDHFSRPSSSQARRGKVGNSATSPTLHSARDVRPVDDYVGRTWCVTVPTGLIVVQRAQRNLAGEVTKASRPTIVGNCLQVTFQTRNIREARHLYDHLAVLSPIMLALSAATPFHRGRIADTDVRWTVISQAVDDRTVKERGEEDLSAVELERRASIADYEKPLPQSHAEPPSPPSAASRRPQRLYKSRYDSISCFLSLESDLNPAYNDVPCEQDAQSYEALIAAGIDGLLAAHISHLFVRDPLVIYDESLVQDDEKSSDHFENLQSTNWQTVRFKPPPPSQPGQPVTGWRVEFRTMEVQLTDFENAAFTVFVALISRAILYFNLNLYLPISRVDDNLSRAHRRDAINTQRFHWRKVVKNCPPEDSEDSSSGSKSGNKSSGGSSSPCGGSPSSSEPEWEQMSIGEIMLGRESCHYPGLIPLVRTYLDMIQCDAQTLEVVNGYLELLSLRACGQLLTAASWLRKFVSVHPEYQHDSQLRQSVVADLMRSIEQIQSGKIEVTQLLGKLRTAATEERKEREEREGKDGEDEEQGGSGDQHRVELKGAPALLDLEDAVCCEKFREYLKRHSNDIGRQQQRTCQDSQQHVPH